MKNTTTTTTAEPVSRDQIFRREKRGQGNVHFTWSADHEQDCPYPVDPHSCYIALICVTIQHNTIQLTTVLSKNSISVYTCMLHQRHIKGAERSNVQYYSTVVTMMVVLYLEVTDATVVCLVNTRLARGPNVPAVYHFLEELVSYITITKLIYSYRSLILQLVVF